MSNPPKISAAIITLNEEANIKACIQSLDFVDEVVVVDSLSQDATVKIASAMGAKVIEQSFLGHVRQKQLAVDSCKHDWVLCLDADERVNPELRQGIQDFLDRFDEAEVKQGYAIARKSFHLGRWITHGGWWPDRKVRLFNRNHGQWGGVDPHDKIEIQGPEGVLPGYLEHYLFQDLRHNVDTNNSYSSISAKILFEKGHKPSLIKLLIKPWGKFIETYLIKRGFLDGMAGFIISVGAAYSMFLKYAKLWEHHNRAKGESKDA